MNKKRERTQNTMSILNEIFGEDETITLVDADGTEFEMPVPPKKELMLIKKVVDKEYDSAPAHIQIKFSKRAYMVSKVACLVSRWNESEDITQQAITEIMKLIESVYPNNQIK